MRWRACSVIIRDSKPSTTADAKPRISLTDAQLVIAREHGFESWPKFASHIATLNLTDSVASLDNPVSAFLAAATVPRDNSHSSGTLEEAELVLARYPQVARSAIYTALCLQMKQAFAPLLRKIPPAQPRPAVRMAGMRSPISVFPLPAH